MIVKVYIKNCGNGDGGFAPGNDCASGNNDSGITIPNNGINENVDTSEWPLATSKIVVNLNSQEYRDLLKDLAITEKQEISPKLSEMMGVATSDKFKSNESQKVYFGLSDFSHGENQKEMQSLGSRSVTSDLERAKTYAGNNGNVYELTIPIGTQIVNSEVLGIKESVLLPGSKFKIGQTKNGITNLTLENDGSDFIKDAFNFQKELDEIFNKNKKEKQMIVKLSYIKNCGNGAGGLAPGNDCAGGGGCGESSKEGGSSKPSSKPQKMKVTKVTESFKDGSDTPTYIVDVEEDPQYMPQSSKNHTISVNFQK